MLRSQRSLTARALAGLAAGVILLAACGSDDSSSDVPEMPLESQSSTTAPGDTSPTTSGADTTAPESTAVAPTPDKPTVTSLPTLPLATLGITDITEGTGPGAADGDTVVVDYVGVRSEDGTEFDNSYDRGQPFPVAPLGQASVIEGWNVGLVGAKAGGRRQLDIPAAMAYGDSPSGDIIQPGDDLTFIVDIRAIVAAADPASEPAITVEPTSGTTATTSTDLTEGTGDEAAVGTTAMVQYIAFSGADGAKLGSSWEQGGTPLSFTVGSGDVIVGFDTGVEGMKVGGRRQVTITPEDAFGPDGNSDLGLPAGADLIMVFDLVAVL